MSAFTIKNKNRSLRPSSTSSTSSSTSASMSMSAKISKGGVPRRKTDGVSRMVVRKGRNAKKGGSMVVLEGGFDEDLGEVVRSDDDDDVGEDGEQEEEEEDEMDEDEEEEGEDDEEEEDEEMEMFKLQSEDDESQDEDDEDEDDEDQEDSNDSDDSDSPKKQSKKTTKTQTPAATSTTSTAPPLQTFQGFHILPLTMPPLSLLPKPAKSIHTPHTPLLVRKLISKTQGGVVNVTHHLLFRKHTSKKEDVLLPRDRTLFVCNVPVDANEGHFRRLFRRCGRVVRVVFDSGNQEALLDVLSNIAKSNKNNKNDDDDDDEEMDDEDLLLLEGDGVEEGREILGSVRKSGGHAHIVFADSESVERAINMRSRRRVWSDQIESEEQGELLRPSSKSGLAKYISEYVLSHPPLNVLKSESNRAVKEFEEMEYAKQLEIESQRNKPDEDGFILVTRGGTSTSGRKNRSRTDGEGAKVEVVSRVDAEGLKEDAERKRKKKELVDFYRFQMREAKRNREYMFYVFIFIFYFL
jgi:ribosomal RNA-processing protein 7